MGQRRRVCRPAGHSVSRTPGPLLGSAGHRPDSHWRAGTTAAGRRQSHYLRLAVVLVAGLLLRLRKPSTVQLLLSRFQRTARGIQAEIALVTDRKSTRLNSSHVSISYAVFCLKKKKVQ